MGEMAPLFFEALPSGYSKLASLIAKEQDYAVFRKFTNLNARNLLYLQAEVMHLEHRLQAHDASLTVIEEGNAILSSWPKFTEDAEAARLVKDIRGLLGEYNTALVLYNQVLSINAPTPLLLGGLRDWCRDNRPISDISHTYFDSREIKGDLKKSLFVKKKINKDLETGYNDLAALNAPDQSWLSCLLRKSFLRWIFIDDYIYLSDRKSFISFYPGRYIDRIATGIAIFLCVLITVTAIALVEHQTSDVVRISLIGVFGVIIAVIIALSGAKKAEVLIGTVGFIAVIVVFLSAPNTPSSNPVSSEAIPM